MSLSKNIKEVCVPMTIGATDFPYEYPCFYSDKIKSWLTFDEYAEMFPDKFADFILNKTDQSVIVCFVSDKLSYGGKKYAMIFVYVSFIGFDIFMEGVKRGNSYDMIPDKAKKNAPYQDMITDDEMFNYSRGERIYLGLCNGMSWVKDVLMAYNIGEINETGSTPDYEGMVLVF